VDTEHGARNFYLQQCLPPYRARDYKTTKEVLHTYFERYEQVLSIREKLMARLAMVTSLLACMENNGNNLSYSELFKYHIDKYFDEVKQADLKTLAPEPFLDCFSIAIRFSLKNSLVESIAETVVVFYKNFINTTVNKMVPGEYLDIWIKEIHNERRNFSRPDRLERSMALTSALIDTTSKNESLLDFCIEGHRIMADMIYFSQSGNMSDDVRFKKVVSHLDIIIQAKPDDIFALKFKKHINDLSGSMLQIRRFQHDTSSTLGNLSIHMEKLKNQCPAHSPLYPVILRAMEEVRTLRTVSSLVTDTQPAITDWEEIDIKDVILPLLDEKNFSRECVKVIGKVKLWECCPNLVALVFKNLVKNSLEAYGRKGIDLPDIPVKFHIEYSRHTVFFRDFAGGIDPLLGDVFEPYRSSKGVYSNVGLGLPQAKKAMEIQDFSIELFPEQPENGALFLLDFT